ncbi:ribonuclease D [Utexia brackfieldae]|uniref:ribonuclease D n=1 Tax=Utexia brackfieldae TaxID=3074108 RepID=UPI00370DC1F0
MNYQLITHNKQLAAICQALPQNGVLALDTEFMRTRTYYPKLGLIQLYTGDNLVLIDPTHITDWYDFCQILNATNHTKYFHACSEDIDVFMHHFKLIPAALLDSQILAAFLDNPVSSGYAGLVSKYLDTTLDKSETRTDWLARPLTEKQCQYAAADVYYLLPLMNKLIDLVKTKGWFAAAQEECQTLVAKKQEIMTPDLAYLNIKKAWQLKGTQLNLLQRLAAWRLEYARSHDMAINFVINEEHIWKLARYHPSSLAELQALGLHGKEVRLYGSTLLNLLSQPVQQVLPKIERITDYPKYKKIAEQLKQMAEQISQETGLSAELLLSRRHINHYVEWLKCGDSIAPPELIAGWRAPLFKDHLSYLSSLKAN